MKYVGAHVSASGGVSQAPINAKNINARAFGLFVKNQKRWEAKPLENSEIEKFKNEINEFGYNVKHILPHAGYLINLGNPESEKREKSYNSMIDEAGRCEQLGLTLINVHPGSHLKLISEEECLGLIADSINHVHANTESISIVLENTAGMGSNIGYKFEHLRDIISLVKDKNRVGVCIDTCHAFAAGYDLRTKETYNKTMEDFGKIVGFEYLKGIHLNDSMYDLGLKKDRHESLLKGKLGEECFRLIMNDKRLDDIPIILETIDETIWAEEIEFLYSLSKN
ncbi:deoxyribonuclease IV [Sebaldella sp. S0638]|uniref:deoxyribonuclease IV n=1 Tax=Sebaldella sp. S0638 TaxID=2957809 RepID=UPI0020A1E8D8|nr:deoxyribonuclease IV [Sebaldella sp. S0638]MCP1225574.1 deoxyribonuclease IV [Sebaldella sp. S0638]